MVKKQMINTTIVIIAVVVIATVSYFIVTKPREEVTPPLHIEATLEDNIKAALADNKSVAKDKIDIQFYSLTENQGTIAVGAVIGNERSILFS